MVKQTVDIKHVSDAIDKLLETYSYDVQIAIQKAIKNGGNAYREYIKEEYEKGLNDKKFEIYKALNYQTLFTTKDIGPLARRLKNKEYRLSHLLENGHRVFNQYGGPYDIHSVDKPILFGYRKDGTPILYGSEYGTSGKITHKGNFFGKTYDFMEKDLPERIENYVKKVKAR